jgi:hypothetical protein
MDTTNDETPRPPDAQPLGFWLRTVDGLLARRFAQALKADGLERRDGMLLNALSGEVAAPWLAERLARGGKRMRALAERGWVARDEDGAWTLTEEGRAATQRLSSTVDDLRAQVAGAVSPEDFATTLACLEAIARELGWDETQPGRPPRGFGRDRRHVRGFGPGFRHDFEPGFRHVRGFEPGFGPGLRHGFGPRFRHDSGPARGFGPGFRHGGHAPGHGDFDLGHGFGPGWGHDAEHCAGHGHGARHHHGAHHDRGAHDGGGPHAYERGFDAGFARGREAAASGTAVSGTAAPGTAA